MYKKIFTLFFILFVISLGNYLWSPPAPVPADSPAVEFSAERAFRYAEAIGHTPHPVGSGMHEEVRQYIVGELAGLGLSPRIQQGIGVHRTYRSGAWLENIIARIPGSEGSGTIALMAHYDSVPNGGGAGDDGSGVATILEGVRAILAGEPLKHDILVVFTDGEEMGLLGAELFVSEYPDLDSIDLVFNFEARGTSGTSFMFETGEGNAKLIPHFAKAVPDPVANSLTYLVYKLLPNDTDFSTTRRAGLNGLNFAFIGDYLNYHTRQDIPENLSLKALQHHGDNLLAAVRYFGDLDTDLEADSDLIYFNNLTGGLTYYSKGWGIAFSVITVLFFLLALYLGFRNRLFTPLKSLGGFLAFLVILALTGAVAWFGWKFFAWLHPEYGWLQHGETYQYRLYFWGFIALTLLIFTASYTWLNRKLSLHNLMAGVFTVWTILLVITSWHLTLASYLFQWPLLFALLGWIWLMGEEPQQEYSWKTVFLLSVSMLPGLFILVPYMKFIHIALTTSMLAVSMALLILLAGMAWPAILFIVKEHRLPWFGGLGCLVLIMFVWAGAAKEFTPEQKKHNNLIYFADLDSTEYYWISRDPEPDEWTGRFLGENPHRGKPDSFGLLSPSLLYAEAPSLEIPAPEITVVKESVSDSLRHLTLEVTSPVRGNAVQVKMERGLNPHIFAFNGQTIHNAQSMPERSFSNFVYFSDLGSSSLIDLSLPDSVETFTLEFDFISYGLPDLLMEEHSPRPEYSMPNPFGLGEATVWKKRFIYSSNRPE